MQILAVYVSGAVHAPQTAAGCSGNVPKANRPFFHSPFWATPQTILSSAPPLNLLTKVIGSSSFPNSRPSISTFCVLGLKLNLFPDWPTTFFGMLGDADPWAPRPPSWVDRVRLASFAW